MGRTTSKSTVVTTFAPDVMEAIRHFNETAMPDASLSATVQELVIIGLARTAEEGVLSAARRREIRNVRRLAFKQLALALNELVTKVDESARELAMQEMLEDAERRE